MGKPKLLDPERIFLRSLKRTPGTTDDLLRWMDSYFRSRRPSELRNIDTHASLVLKFERGEDITTQTMEVEAMAKRETQPTTKYPRARKPDHRPLFGPPLAELMGVTKKQKQDILSQRQLEKAFPDEAAAVEFVEKAVWGDDPICPRCGLTETVYKVKNGKPMRWRCRDCRRYFSVKVGTSLEESNLPLRTWIMAIYQIHTARKGVSAVQLSPNPPKEWGLKVC